MSLRFDVTTQELTTRHAFNISRGGSALWNTVLLQVNETGLEGWGEGYPNPYYGEDLAGAVAALNDWIARRSSLADLDIGGEMHAFRGPDSARAALDIAMHDLQARRGGRTVSEFLEREYRLERRPPARSSFTIGLDSLDKIAEKVREARDYPVLKVKLGGPEDLAVLEAVRSATGAELRVDANAAWSVEETLEKAPRLAELGVTLLEQPLARNDLAGYRALRGKLPMPVYADESCKHLEHIARLEGAVDGINIKLSKCGGLWEAARMVRSAREHALGVMIGCFIESSVGITAAASLAPFADALDLDGAALLAWDPFVGVEIPRGEVRMPRGSGLGVERR